MLYFFFPFALIHISEISRVHVRDIFFDTFTKVRVRDIYCIPIDYFIQFYGIDSNWVTLKHYIDNESLSDHIHSQSYILLGFPQRFIS